VGLKTRRAIPATSGGVWLLDFLNRLDEAHISIRLAHQTPAEDFLVFFLVPLSVKTQFFRMFCHIRYNRTLSARYPNFELLGGRSPSRDVLPLFCLALCAAGG
jgi:hypothetical protein